jgi:hypothetical protein
MPLFLDTRGNPSVAIAVCDRCKMKRAYSVMRSDPNFPGLRVCDQGCADQKDPYRLPARKTERIALRFPRPDLSIALQDNNLITTGYGGYVVSTQQNDSNPSDNGNLTGIEV